jgi:hypothetical protein
VASVCVAYVGLPSRIADSASFADISRAGAAGVGVARLEDDDPGKPGGQRRR